MVSHLLNIDQALAEDVAKGLRIIDMPSPANAARPTQKDLDPSPALSILKNGPKSFAGRTVGILVTDGVDIELLKSLLESLKQEGASAKIIAPRVGGVKASDGKMYKADEMIDGAPSVLFDAVALMLSKEGADELAKNPVARNFVSDAFAHQKFIAHTEPALALIESAMLNERARSQLVAVGDGESIESFLSKCRKLRSWMPEPVK